MSRLHELAERYGVPAEGEAALDRLLSLLERDDNAPTAVRERPAALDRHVADALSGLVVPELERARRVADLGAGAGVPGLVLAAARPRMSVFEVESVGRKCAFMEGAIAEMGLANAAVVHARAEEWSAGIESCDVVTARALAPLPVLVEYAAPLLCGEGVLVAWKGAPQDVEIADGNAAAERLGLSPAREVPVRPWEGAQQRSLYVYLKVRSLPNGFPRRPGIARKRPIQASSAG